MIIRIGIENNVEGRSMAWALEHPGCFAYAEDSQELFIALPDAIARYSDWIANRLQHDSWMDFGQGEVEFYLEETWDVYAIDQDFNPAEDGYEVNAWFRHDWKPLSQQDVERGMQILDWSRSDLLDSIANLSAAELSLPRPGERWDINGILRHVAKAEWWYLDRLGLAFPWEEMPRENTACLQNTRHRLLEALPTLIGLKNVVGVDGEFWSPRKVLRRAAWHERDHTQHILRLARAWM
jgi:hypothetical protein